MARKVKIVSTALSTDSAGNVVDALPVREETGPTLNEVGKYVDPVEVEVDEDFGAPVRYVSGLVTTDSAGRIVPVTPIAGANLPPVSGAVQLLVSQDDIGNTTYWQHSRLSVSGPSTGPQGAENAWEVICSGENDPLLVQAPLPPVSLAGRSLLLRVWAKSGNTEGYPSGFQFFSYDTLFAGGIDQVQNQEKAITASWARYELEVAFTTWAEGDMVTWRLDPYDVTGGTNQPIAGASIFIAKPELWLLPA